MWGSLHKIPRVQSLAVFQTGEHMEVLGEWHAQRGQEASVFLPTDIVRLMSSIWMLNYILQIYPGKSKHFQVLCSVN